MRFHAFLSVSACFDASVGIKDDSQYTVFPVYPTVQTWLTLRAPSFFYLISDNKTLEIFPPAAQVTGLQDTGSSNHTYLK